MKTSGRHWNDGSVSEHDGNPVGNVEGRIYWPVVCGAPTDTPTEAKLPLVIVIHGDGHHLDDYEYFMEHLAKNGFIAATIDGRQEISNVERAERIRTYLTFMREPLDLERSRKKFDRPLRTQPRR